MANEILVSDAQGNEWMCSYVVTAGAGMASGQAEKGSEGQCHYWRCVRGEHVRTMAVPLDIDFRKISDEERARLIDAAFNISGEWERR